MRPIPGKKYLLLDSCIAEYSLDEHISQPISDTLLAWLSDDFTLATSEISYAELIDGAFKAKVERVKQLLNNYTQFEVTQRVLSGAGIISNIYKAKFNQTSGASLQDRIIAATSFIYNLPIVTANIQDFPHPFFTSFVSKNILYHKKKKHHYITVDILLPNNDLLKYWYSRTK
jgi:predicted nucleic acid-binding protein